MRQRVPSKRDSDGGWTRPDLDRKESFPSNSRSVHAETTLIPFLFATRDRIRSRRAVNFLRAGTSQSMAMLSTVYIIF